MFSLAVIKALQIYGIAIAISLFVAVLIKALVNVTGRVEKGAKKTTAPLPAPTPESSDIPDEVISVITAAVAAITGPHRILTIAESSRTWSREGRSAQHSHQPKH